MLVLLQILGALAILGPFAYSQARPEFKVTSPAYLWPNIIGSGLLSGLAAIGSQWGFLLLESAWMLTGIYGLLGRKQLGRIGRRTQL